MKKLLLFSAGFLFLGCSHESSHYVGVEVSKPALDWQKGSETIQRGFYEESSTLDVNMYYTMIAPECDRTPALPDQIFTGARLITYRNSPRQEDGKPAREQELSINRISKVEHSRYTVDTQLWSRNSAFIDDALISASAELAKVPVEGTNRYRPDWTSQSVSESQRGLFPGVDRSAMMEVLEETLKDQANPQGEFFTRGLFHFGNGDVIPAIQRVRIIRVNETKAFGEIEVRLPKQPGLYDVNCVAATAFFGKVDMENGQFINEDETELLFTTARAEEGK
jgi:hypothetical protein